jgi:GNAT superfamily N-acetyltransferase
MTTITPTTSPIEVILFDAQYAHHFSAINYEWLESYFEIEKHDREILDHPIEEIMDKGGQIFFAKSGNEIVGTAALIVEEEGVFELAKMGVYPKYRGQKIGQLLIEHTVEYAKKVGYKSLVLDSSTKLPPALNLYIKNGFRVIPLTGCSPYARCNIRMQLVL